MIPLHKVKLKEAGLRKRGLSPWRKPPAVEPQPESGLVFFNKIAELDETITRLLMRSDLSKQAIEQLERTKRLVSELGGLLKE